MNSQNLSEEDQFLIRVCIEFEQNNTSQNLSELKTFNWESLLQKANAHGIIPIIHLWCVHHGVSNDIPIGKITGVYNQVLALNVVLENAYAEVSKELLNNEIESIPLKGMRLLQLKIYENIGARQLSDVDLFIREKDLNKARNVFKKMGFWEKAELSTDILKLCQTPTPFEYIKNNVFIDLHIGLNRKGTYDLLPEEVWRTCNANGLSNSDFLIHLACHAHKHMLRNGVRLISLVDIKLFLEKELLDWETIASRCKLFKCESEFYSILFLTQTIFKLNPIAAVNNYFSNAEKLVLETQALQILNPSSFEKDRFNLKKVWINESAHLMWPLRLFVLFRKLFPNAEFLSSNYRNTSRLFRLFQYYKFQKKKFI
jgi:hypothetical protein